MEIEGEIRQWFKKCRRERKLSRSALAEELGVSLATVERFENGRGMMNWKFVSKGFNVLGYEPIFSLRMIDTKKDDVKPTNQQENGNS